MMDNFWFKLAFPTTESELFRRTNERVLNEEPKCTASSTDTNSPTFVNLLTLTELAKLTKSNTLSFPYTTLRPPAIDILEPNREYERRLIADPTCRKLITLTEDPKRANERNEKELDR